LGNKAQTHVINTTSGPIQVVTIPWARRSTLLTRQETKGLSLEKINETIQQKLDTIISELASALDPSIPSILTSHVTISGAKTSSEQSMMLGRDYVLLNSSVSLPSFDYVALGHIHKQQVINESNPTVTYSGSLERIDFGEENDEKGFYSVDLDEKAQSGNRVKKLEFIKVNSRVLLTIKVEIDSEDIDPTNKVLKEISKHDLEETVVRLIISMPSSYEGKLIDSQIREALNKAHYIAGISITITGAERARLGSDYNSNTSPIETLKMYLKVKKVPDQRAELLIDTATSIMENTPAIKNAKNK